MTESRRNHKYAWGYFVSIGKIPRDAGKNEWCLHHRDITLKTTDPDRYHKWLIEDLEPMLKSEHIKLHQSGRKRSKETRELISSKLKGKKRTEEQRQRISEATKLAFQKPENIAKLKARPSHSPWNKGMKKARPQKFPQRGRVWVTNGSKDLKVPPDEIPEGYMLGRSFHFAHTEETKAKMRKPKSKETILKFSLSQIGMKFWNNGAICIRARECPGLGWTRGLLKSNKRQNANG